ncbi:MAG: lipopolysaccharide transport periplasmic protein LptA [Pseudomonadaceae bacterium]|nr:lipopolysaccharide transport periplasmic protein LptA [Pseudomonadaceae bacterium]
MMKDRAMRYALLLSALLAMPVWAAPITVDAARLDVDRAANTATFSGGVTIKQADLTLTAARVVGDLAAGGLRDITATGNVKIVRGSGENAETATGDKAVYTPTSGKLVLTGDVSLTRGGNTLRGNRLDYDVKAGKASMTGAGSVRGTFSGDAP